jgi:L-histidine Nalpha-methyltransferase
VAPNQQFALDVATGLTKSGQKELPSKYLYDSVGSALFEAITVLPEYGLTRADERLLRLHARGIILKLPGAVRVAELGSGSGKKTRWILEALAHRGPVVYHPIDVSASALARCERELAGVGCTAVCGLEGSYLEGLSEVCNRRLSSERILVLFLGSTIGNFDRDASEEFLREVRRRLAPGDALLLGADLVKPAEQLIHAYDDPAGITAAFNLNLLARINRELGGEFDLRQFEHVARWEPDTESVEMHLRSRTQQSVGIRAANIQVRFAGGETIWTEACHKFRADALPSMAKRAGFVSEAQWIDTEWPFSESLWVAV